MTTSLRFQFYIHRWTLVILPSVLLAIVGLCYLFPESDFLAGYYSVLPALPIFAAAGAGLGAFTTQMNFAFSMGELRHRFFLASQISALFYALFGTLMIMAILTLDLNARLGFYFDLMHQMKPLNLIFIIFTNYIIGSALGVIICTNRTFGLVLLGILGLVVGAMSALGTILVHNAMPWSTVTTIGTIVCGVITLICELLLWRRTQTYAVK